MNQKLEALLVLIGEEKIKRKLLEAQLKDKQERLKQLMRENMRLEKSRTLLTVSASKKDRSHLARSYSTKDRLTFSESKQKLSVLDRKGNTQKLRIMSIQ